MLVDDLDSAMDWLFEAFRIYPSERVDIVGSGVNNAVYAFANHTYLELIAPYNEESSAYRLLSRSGPGWRPSSHPRPPEAAPIRAREFPSTHQ